MENSISKTIKFVALYARVSTSNQEDQKTVEAQLSEDREYAKARDYIIVKEYIDEGWSGDILARPSLDQLRADARKNMWDAVIVYDPDRLGRKLFYQQIVIEELERLEVSVLFVTMPPIKNSTDELMFGIRGLFAAYEKAKIAERFRIGKVNRVKNGFVLTSEAPYGYTYILNKGKRGNADYVAGHYEINEREKKIVQDIFNWVADDKLTIRAVIKRLFEKGIKPRWSNRGVWSTSTMSTLLRNEVYIGTSYWGASYAMVPLNPVKKGGYKKIEKTSKRMKPRDQWIPIKVPAIIEKDIFERAGAQLKKNFESLGRNKKNDYLLARRIYCVCGSRRAGEGPQHGKFLYYRCNSRVTSFPLPSKCKEKGINARIADNIVWQRIKDIMSSPELMVEQIEQWLINIKNNKPLDSTINVESTKSEIKRLQIQEDRLAKAYAQEVFSLEKFEEYVNPIRKKISEFQNQIYLANLEKTPKDEILLPSNDEIEIFAKEALEHLEGLDFPAKQAIVRQVVNRIIASRESLQVFGLISLSEIYVIFFSEYSYRWSAKRRQVHAF